MIDQWSDRSSFQRWILWIPRGQRKWSSLTLSPLGTCLCSDGLWLMAACGYWCVTLSRFDSAWGRQRSGSLGSDEWSRRGPDGLWLDSHISLGSCEPQSQKWKHIVSVAPRLPHISFSISHLFCAGCQNIQCKWCCFFLSLALDVSTRNSLAACRQVWRSLSRSGVPALPFNQEPRTSSGCSLTQQVGRSQDSFSHLFLHQQVLTLPLISILCVCSFPFNTRSWLN